MLTGRHETHVGFERGRKEAKDVEEESQFGSENDIAIPTAIYYNSADFRTK